MTEEAIMAEKAKDWFDRKSVHKAFGIKRENRVKIEHC
tara:strand:+ start:14763 stop:14876 length:114 start_codon:yes stop_codon:yes gene_type:complete